MTVTIYDLLTPVGSFPIVRAADVQTNSDLSFLTEEERTAIVQAVADHGLIGTLQPVYGETPDTELEEGAVRFNGTLSANISDYQQTAVPGTFGGVLYAVVRQGVTVLGWQTATFAKVDGGPFGYDTWRLTYSAGSDPEPRSIVGGVKPIIGVTWPELEVGAANLAQSVRDQLAALEGRPVAAQLPDSLTQLARHLEWTTYDDVDSHPWTSALPHQAPIKNAFSVLDAHPDSELDGATYPPDASHFYNEIPGSSLGATLHDPSSIFIKTPTDGGLDTVTSGALTGPGIYNDYFEIPTGDELNPNFIVSGRQWLAGEGGNLLSLDEDTPDADQRVLLRVGGNRLQVQRTTAPASTTTRKVTYRLYGTDSLLTHTFEGVGAQEGEWVVDEAREYTLTFRLITNGNNNRGSASLNYTVANLAVSQAASTHTLTFAPNEAGEHTQEVKLSYVAQTTLYGGSGHTLRVSIEELADNHLIDIDHLEASVTYTENVTDHHNAAFEYLNQGPALPQGGTFDWLAFVFEGSNENVHLVWVVKVGGVTQRGEVDLGYRPTDLIYSKWRLSGQGLAGQIFEGWKLPGGFPPEQFPDHVAVQSYLEGKRTAGKVVLGQITPASEEHTPIEEVTVGAIIKSTPDPSDRNVSALEVVNVMIPAGEADVTKCTYHITDPRFIPEGESATGNFTSTFAAIGRLVAVGQMSVTAIARNTDTNELISFETKGYEQYGQDVIIGVPINISSVQDELAPSGLSFRVPSSPLASANLLESINVHYAPTSNICVEVYLNRVTGTAQ